MHCQPLLVPQQALGTAADQHAPTPPASHNAPAANGKAGALKLAASGNSSSSGGSKRGFGGNQGQRAREPASGAGGGKKGSKGAGAEAGAAHFWLEPHALQQLLSSARAQVGWHSRTERCLLVFL